MPASEPVQESAPEVSFDSPPAVEEPMAGSDSSMPSSMEPPVLQDVAPPVVEKLPPAPAPENDENQKIREQLMQELLQ